MRILHVDIDAFFAGVEQALNPALRGRPVIVGGDGRQKTVVASCSYEARAHGVFAGMRTEEARQRIPDAVFLTGDYRVYRRAAEEVFTHLRTLSPKVQTASLDEAYVDLRAGGVKSEGDALACAEKLCRHVQQNFHLQLSVGVGTSKLMARLATRLAKPRGCFLIRKGYERRFLDRLAIEQLPGVGRRTAEMLQRFNVCKVDELAKVPRDVMVATFGKRGASLHEFARGRDERAVDNAVLPRSVSRETSLERPANSVGVVFGLACYLLERAMKEVMAKGLRAHTVSVRLQYIDSVSSERAQSVKVATGHEANLVPVVEAILGALFTRRVAVYRVGVTLKNLILVGEERQAHLFEDDQEQRLERLHDALSHIRQRHGFGAVVKGPAVALLGHLNKDRDGFRLRVPSLTR